MQMKFLKLKDGLCATLDSRAWHTEAMHLEQQKISALEKIAQTQAAHLQVLQRLAELQELHVALAFPNAGNEEDTEPSQSQLGSSGGSASNGTPH